jgi:hypothetical protein
MDIIYFTDFRQAVLFLVVVHNAKIRRKFRWPAESFLLCEVPAEGAYSPN